MLHNYRCKKSQSLLLWQQVRTTMVTLLSWWQETSFDTMLLFWNIQQGKAFSVKQTKACNKKRLAKRRASLGVIDIQHMEKYTLPTRRYLFPCVVYQPERLRKHEEFVGSGPMKSKMLLPFPTLFLLHHGQEQYRNQAMYNTPKWDVHVQEEVVSVQLWSMWATLQRQMSWQA